MVYICTKFCENILNGKSYGAETICDGQTHRHAFIEKTICLPRRRGDIMIGERNKSKQPHPHLLQAHQSLAELLDKVVGRPGPASPDHPLHNWDLCLQNIKMEKQSIIAELGHS